MFFYSPTKQSVSVVTVEPGFVDDAGNQLINVIWGKDTPNEVKIPMTATQLEYPDPNTGELKNKLKAESDFRKQTTEEYNQFLRDIGVVKETVADAG